MKINVNIQIEVDPKNWDAVYGTGTSPTAVREDVKRYIFNAIDESPGLVESDATLYVK